MLLDGGWGHGALEEGGRGWGRGNERLSREVGFKDLLLLWEAGWLVVGFWVQDRWVKDRHAIRVPTDQVTESGVEVLVVVVVPVGGGLFGAYWSAGGNEEMLPRSGHESADDGVMYPFPENLIGSVGVGAGDMFEDNFVLGCLHEWTPVTPLQNLNPSDEGDSVYMLQKVEEVGGALTKVKFLDGGLSWEVR